MSEKKNIYQKDMNEMRELLLKFSKTLYGRTVFFLAYFLPLMAFLVLLGLVVINFIVLSYDLFYPIIGTFFLFVVLFILANIYYYHELRIFSEKNW